MGAGLTRRLGDDPGERRVGATLHDLGDAARGPTVVVLGGVHGDEGQGVRGAFDLLDAVAGLELRGRLLVVPVAHEAASAAASRVSPVDGLNLARSFPGDAAGSPTQRLAHLLEVEVLGAADLVLDLHSSGVHYEMAPLAGWCDDGSAASEQARAAAEAMALPVMWHHPGPPPAGRSGSSAHARGTPFVYVESSEADAPPGLYRDACLRALAHLGLIDGGLAPPAPPPTLRLAGPGDIDARAVRADRSGLVEPQVELLARGASGELVASIRGADGSAPGPLLADEGGVVVMLRRTRLVGAGDLIAFITGEDGA
jgi:predicted deacylase